MSVVFTAPPLLLYAALRSSEAVNLQVGMPLSYYSRNEPLACRSGQRAKQEVTELDGLAMNSPSGSAVPNSHDVSESLTERLVTDTNAASDAKVNWITAPEDLQVYEPQLAATVRASTTLP
jgi:hypothetical protein